MALGIGGWRLLQALRLECEVLYLNEGHAAFAVLERVHAAMAVGGLTFAAALWRTRAGNLFTTHTPAAAGFDRFEPRLMVQYLGRYAESLDLALDDPLALGRDDPANAGEPFNMALLAMHGSAAVNGVSRLHGEVSRRIFASSFPRQPLAEVPVGHVTNGVHVPAWESRAARQLWSQICGAERWHGDLATLEADFRSATAGLAQQVEEWLAGMQRRWSRVRIAGVTREADGVRMRIAAEIHLDDLDPDALRLELYADPVSAGAEPERIAMIRGEALLRTSGADRYHADFPAARPAQHYTVRVVPFNPALRLPLECGLVYWER